MNVAPLRAYSVPINHFNKKKLKKKLICIAIKTEFVLYFMNTLFIAHSFTKVSSSFLICQVQIYIQLRWYSHRNEQPKHISQWNRYIILMIIQKVKIQNNTIEQQDKPKDAFVQT